MAQPRPDRHLGRLVGGTLLGAILVAIGLTTALVVIGTPLVARLVPTSPTSPNQISTAMLVWALALAAGAGLLVSGTNRLALTIASVRTRTTGRSPVMRLMDQLPADIVVATGVTLHDGRPVPELVIGPFGVAVVHALDGGEKIRRVGHLWEAQTRDGWVPTEHPLDRVAREADRVRHWLTHGDLEFVVRVYAALVTADETIPRSPLCAVISDEQIPAWLGALPRQRSLSSSRRHRLLTRIRESVAEESSRHSW